MSPSITSISAASLAVPLTRELYRFAQLKGVGLAHAHTNHWAVYAYIDLPIVKDCTPLTLRLTRNYNESNDNCATTSGTNCDAANCRLSDR